MRKSPIDSKSAGQRNEQLVISLLRRHKQLSQTELCRLVGIGSSTASTIVSRLRDKGFVLENQGQSKKRGPKPVILSINPKCYFVIGIEITPSFLNIGIFDYLGQMVSKTKVSLVGDHSPDCVVNLISEKLPQVVQDSRLLSSRILGVGVTLSGSVSAGMISMSSPLGWKNVPLLKMLESSLPYPVEVFSNRVRLFAEFDVNPALAGKDILYLNLANGVGSTVYMNGRLVFGASGRYGEIGHVVVQPDGPVCGCGHRGCLEALISGPVLAERIKQEIAKGNANGIAELLKDNSTKASPEEIIEIWGRAIVENDEYALSLRGYVGDYLAKAAAMAINFYDPEVIILAGYVSSQCPGYFADRIAESIATSVYNHSLREFEIIPAKAGEDALIKGLASAVLQNSLNLIS